MRHFFLLLTAFLFLFPQGVFAEQIDSFYSDITIHKDGSVGVTETIQYDFGIDERHGIFRIIPLIKINQDGKKFRMTIEPELVKSESGVVYTSDVTTEDGALQIKIGDADKTITGKHTYILPYNVFGALTYFSDHDELYWNVTGNDWRVPIQSAKAVVVMPEAFEAEQLQLRCYTGYEGSIVEDCTIGEDAGVVTSTAALAAGEGLTIVVGFPKHSVAILEPTPVVDFFDTLLGKLTLIGILLAAMGWYVALPVWIIFSWWKKGRDPKVPTGIARAWFSPATGINNRPLTPGETGTLLDERADFQDITATIVDLARREYLHIIEKKKNDFQLKKMKKFAADSELLPFEQTLLSGIFKTNDTYDVKGASIVSVVGETKRALYTQVVKEGFFDRNPETTRSLYTALGVFALMTFNIPLSLAAFIFGMAMPAKTIKGATAANVSTALKNFLTSQSRQLKFQAEKQMMFEKLLPYAIAFGVERVWAERFKDMKLQAPTWYEGYRGSRFTSTQFVHHLDRSFSSTLSTAATPTRSSSGFSSGSSGGSSGGGGGGGGGGSW